METHVKRRLSGFPFRLDSVFVGKRRRGRLLMISLYLLSQIDALISPE